MNKYDYNYKNINFPCCYEKNYCNSNKCNHQLNNIFSSLCCVEHFLCSANNARKICDFINFFF